MLEKRKTTRSTKHSTKHNNEGLCFATYLKHLSSSAKTNIVGETMLIKIVTEAITRTKNENLRAGNKIAADA